MSDSFEQLSRIPELVYSPVEPPPLFVISPGPVGPPKHVPVSPIPEPSAFALLLIGIVAVCLWNTLKGKA